MTAPEFETVPARYFVATYGDAGLEIQLFDCPLAYGRAVNTAQRDHARGYNEFGEIDSYTHGDCTISRRVQLKDSTDD